MSRRWFLSLLVGLPFVARFLRKPEVEYRRIVDIDCENCIVTYAGATLPPSPQILRMENCRIQGGVIVGGPGRFSFTTGLYPL